jgi:hypothetical protein
MRKISPWVLAAVLLAPPSFAQIEPSPLSPSSSIRQVAESRPLYLAVSPEQLAGRRLLVVEVVLGSRPQVRESFDLAATQDAGATFELLAGRPDLRSSLEQLAADRSRRLEVRVSLDGEVIRKFGSFQDFVRSSRRLQQGGVSPRQVASTILDLTGHEDRTQSIAAKGYVPDPACQQQCAENYDLCKINDGGCASFGECERCDNDYNHCMGFCPLICVDPKSVRVISDRTDIVGVTNTGNRRCFLYGPPRLYDEIATVYQRTRVIRTEYCDGHYEDRQELTYTYKYCWTSIGYACSFSEGNVPACRYES